LGCDDSIALRSRYFIQADAGDVSDNVDLYNTATGAWTTSQLSVARYQLAAASAGTIAIFAGGRVGSALQLLEPAA
jgi:hypothetical protein